MKYLILKIEIWSKHSKKHADVRGMMAIYKHKPQSDINQDIGNGM